MIIRQCELNGVEELRTLRDVIDEEIVKIITNEKNDLFNSLKEILSTIDDEGYGVYYCVTEDDFYRGNIDITSCIDKLRIL